MIPENLNSLMLRVPAGQDAQFVQTDSLNGFYEAWPGSQVDKRKYMLKDDWLFQYASLSNTTEPSSWELIPGASIEVNGKQRIATSILKKRNSVVIDASNVESGILLHFHFDLDQVSIEKCAAGWLIDLQALALSAEMPQFLLIQACPNSFIQEIDQGLRSVEHFSGVVKRAGFTLKISGHKDIRVLLDFCSEKPQFLPSLNGVWEQHLQQVSDFIDASAFECDDQAYAKAVHWAKWSAHDLVVEEFGTGIWAGLPWFKDNWGRDTFIALPGTSLVTGQFQEAKDVLLNFAKFQNLDTNDRDAGRIPNRVTAWDSIIYNTTDGTPWMIRELVEYVRYSGDLAVLDELYPVVERYLTGAFDHYVDDEGLLTHDDADTWMDARIEHGLPWSARGSRAVEIQSLWLESLAIGVWLAERKGESEKSQAWRTQLEKGVGSFQRNFWDHKNHRVADRIDAAGRKDFSPRPNQLLCLTIPMLSSVLTDSQMAEIVVNAVEHLLLPHGILSLSAEAPWFHPYHDGVDNYHKDSAYHQGTIWGWNAGPAVSGMVYGGWHKLAYRFSKNLTEQILQQACLGSMSENLNAVLGDNGLPVQTGTYSQAWSVSEFARNHYQDYLGFKPNLINNSVQFAPLTELWKRASGRLPLADSSLTFSWEVEQSTLQLELNNLSDLDLKLNFAPVHLSNRYHFELVLKANSSSVIRWSLGERHVVQDGDAIALNELLPTAAAKRPLDFRSLPERDFMSMSGEDVLQQLIESDQYTPWDPLA